VGTSNLHFYTFRNEPAVQPAVQLATRPAVQPAAQPDVFCSDGGPYGDHRARLRPPGQKQVATRIAEPTQVCRLPSSLLQRSRSSELRRAKRTEVQAGALAMLVHKYRNFFFRLRY
jgi:hypothetical protein